MSEKRLRCRYQVWERGRGMGAYQCSRAAKTERKLRVRGTKEQPEHKESLPVCGIHANRIDRDPDAWMHDAYTPLRDDMWHAKVQVYL